MDICNRPEVGYVECSAVVTSVLSTSKSISVPLYKDIYQFLLVIAR